VGWQLSLLQLVQGVNVLVWEESFGDGAIIGFQELVVAESRCQKVHDVQELPLLCLDHHKVVVLFDNEADAFFFLIQTIEIFHQIGFDDIHIISVK